MAQFIISCQPDETYHRSVVIYVFRRLWHCWRTTALRRVRWSSVNVNQRRQFHRSCWCLVTELSHGLSRSVRTTRRSCLPAPTVSESGTGIVL